MSDASPSGQMDRTSPDRQSNKRLPTFRVGFAKQLDALRAYAVLSESGAKPVRYQNIAPIIKLHEVNVSSANPFFLENGFLEKVSGGLLPTAAVLEYNRAYSWKPETAGAKLLSIVEKSWFGAALQQRLLFRTMTEDEAIEALASICMAGPDARPQLKTLIDYCELAELLRRENGQLIANQDARVSQPAQTQHKEEPRPAPTSETQEMRVGGFAPTAGAINFQISVKVDMAEMKGWSADRITAFFGGIAQVLAAQEKKQG